jgi:hypothetical protein
MKTSRILVLSFFLIALPLIASASDNPETDSEKLPEKALIISQAYTMYYTLYTMIDLTNNEMVIVMYGTKSSLSDIYKLRKVIRTGIKLDPEEHKQMAAPTRILDINRN